MKLKIVCLNLWRGGKLFDPMVDFLRAEDADLVLLQEVYDGSKLLLDRRFRSLMTLRETLDYPFYSSAPSWTEDREEGKIPLGLAILSKLPIQATDVTFFYSEYRDDCKDTPEFWPIYPRNLQHAELLSPVGILNIYNFHGVWDLDGDNFSTDRQKMSRAILKAIEGKQNVILAGDTNAKTTNPALRAIETHLTSVFGDTRTTSFNMRQKDNPGYTTAVVDHMYISPTIEVVSATMPDVDISDHLPLVVELNVSSN